MTTETRTELLAKATAAGEEHGRNAASWYFDGNTSDETYQRASHARRENAYGAVAMTAALLPLVWLLIVGYFLYPRKTR